MKATQLPIFEPRLTLAQSIELTATSLNEYGQSFRHWVMAYSGGKDSHLTIALTIYLIEQGLVKAPEALTVLMSDTGQEFLPLHLSALETLEVVRKRGYNTQVVKPTLDHRLYVYLLGRGVPPAGGDHFRWCTRILKSDPMDEAVELLAQVYGEILVLTGVREGESAARDQRISLSCSRDGGECGQGWFQNSNKPGISSTLAPILHWRLCNVEDFTLFFTPSLGFPTQNLIDIYGFEEDEQLSIRTGCAGCMLVEKDKALDRIISLPEWGYLAPLRGLRAIYDELLKPWNRLRKNKFEPRKVKVAKTPKLDLTLDWTELREQVKKLPRTKKAKQYNSAGRLGPLTMEARLWGLDQVLAIQDEINTAAQALGRPKMWLITQEEEARIRELIDLNTWPDGWTGNEPRGDAALDRVVNKETTWPIMLA